MSTTAPQAIAGTGEACTPRDYLSALYGQCEAGDLVFVASDRRTVSAVFSVTDLESAAAHVESSDVDLFLKVNVMDHAKTVSRSPYGIGGVKEVSAVVSLHLDVDAGKNDDKYLTPERMLDALDRMPLAPSAIIQTNGDDGGFHAYWILETPHYIADDADRQRCQDISTRWLEELRDHAKPGTIDGTADLCRVLRPVGSLRKSGNRVRALIWNPGRRFRLDDFLLPPKPSTTPTFDFVPSDGERVLDRYLDDRRETVESILTRQNYTHYRGDYWQRPGSESGAHTGEIYTLQDGRRGFTVKSGAADPLSCQNRDGSTGRWYSREELFVVFEHGGDWTAAARAAHEHFDAIAPKVDISGIERQAVKPAAGNVNNCLQNDPTTSTPSTSEPKPPPSRSAAALFGEFLDRLRKREGDVLFETSDCLRGFEIGPGLITALGAGPGAGKSALASQAAFDALEMEPRLTVLVANAEMSWAVLARRELARRTGLGDRELRFGEITDSQMERIEDVARIDLMPLMERIQVLQPPYTIDALETAANAMEPGLLIVDYLQKFAPPGDAREGVNGVMTRLRWLASDGWAVLALSATTRTKSSTGSGHDSKGLSLASFKESGEIEFNADSAYLLRDMGPVEGQHWKRKTVLDCVKNRHGERAQRELIFDMPRMQFSQAVPDVCNWSPGDDPGMEGFDDA